MSNEYISPLRYPGGKARLTPYIKAILNENALLGGVYAEPYAGGSSVGLRLLFDGYVRSIRINDLDRGVYAFWRSVINRPKELCDLIKNTRPTPDNWYRLREIYLDPNSVGQTELGFATFFLNRTNRSGIIQSGGMIGGTRQDGKWKLDARYNAAELIDRINRIALRRKDIEVTNMDAEDFIASLAADAPEQTFAYLDPPYFVKGTQRLYAAYYGPEEHYRISESLGSAPFHWIVSYDDVEEIRRLYTEYATASYTLSYSASKRCIGKEVVFFSPMLRIPDCAPDYYSDRTPRNEFAQLRRPRKALI